LWTGGVSRSKLLARLDDMLDTCRQLSGRDSPDIDICETNSPRPRYRAEWFTLLAQWMSDHGGGYLETFWNPNGPLSGPWLPDDARTIEALRTIAANLAGRRSPSHRRSRGTRVREAGGPGRPGGGQSH
jgi:hypothetical protein